MQTRREFFKKAAKGVLPVLGAIALANVPLLSHAMEEGKTPNGCNYGCMGSCYGSCNGGCMGCSGTCTGGCSGCGGNCFATCEGSCSRACDSSSII